MALLVLATVAFAVMPVAAQQAQLTLVPDKTPWNEQVEVRIEGVGCSGAFVPVVEVVRDPLVIDIDLLDCDAASTTPFRATAKVGPFYPYTFFYLIRVRNGSSTPEPDPLALPVLASAPLAITHVEPAYFVLPEVATDAAPVTISTQVKLASDCHFIESTRGPYIEGNVIELEYSSDCHNETPPPDVARLEVIRWEIPHLDPGTYDVRLIRWWTLPITAPRFEAMAWRQLVVHDADRCLPSPTVLCLGSDRFKVEAVWRDFGGGTGVGHARPLEGDDASGLLWFFAPDNVELTAKILDGCSVNDHFWFFLASGSTVEYTVTVTDTVTGAKRTYANPSGHSAPLLTDTSAFSCGGR